MCGVTGEVAAFQSLFRTTTKMSHIERRNDEQMPKEPTPRGGNPLPDSDNELVRRTPEELMPSGVHEPDDQPMPSSALPPDNADLVHRACSPPNNELARHAPEELTPSGIPEPDDQPTDLARLEPPPSKRQKPRSVARFLDLAAEEDEDSGDDDAPRGVQRATLAEDGEDDGDDDEETRSDLEFIDDEPVHQASRFLIPEETDATALEALSASSKAAPALSLDPSAVATSTHDDSVLNLFQPKRQHLRMRRRQCSVKKPYEGKIAWVVSSQRFIVANLTTFGEEDSCSRLKYDSPLCASIYPRVLPNPYELLPFKQTGEPYLKKATFIGTAPALVEGVHVVVVAGKHEGYVGYIVNREIADGKHVAWWAKIQENNNGTDTVHAKTPGIEAQILHLRRHALDLPTPFRVLDRVQVVTGIEHRGAIGRIVQVEDEWLIHVQLFLTGCLFDGLLHSLLALVQPLPPSHSPTPPLQASWTLNSQTLDGDFGARFWIRAILSQQWRHPSSIPRRKLIQCAEPLTNMAPKSKVCPLPANATTKAYDQGAAPGRRLNLFPTSTARRRLEMCAGKLPHHLSHQGEILFPNG
ncbi:hypothetical protein B0H14DRAFT_2632371 [Mycena olivaceomarginata]|nr:hypothetical protein B0H14DRAFT_2632371 [Mycena olivaceomarginata]